MDTKYELTLVGRYIRSDGLVIITFFCEENELFETIVAHPAYAGGNRIITVELYDSLAASQKGHGKWWKILTSDPPPVAVFDVWEQILYFRG